MSLLRNPSTARLVAVGIAIAVLLVVFVAPFADSDPDGLERVAADTGIDAGASDHRFVDGPFADYGVDGVDHQVMSTWLAGGAGIAVTFAVGAGAVWVVRRRRPPSPTDRAPV